MNMGKRGSRELRGKRKTIFLTLVCQTLPGHIPTKALTQKQNPLFYKKKNKTLCFTYSSFHLNSHFFITTFVTIYTGTAPNWSS